MRWKACGASATLERVRCTFTSLSAWVSQSSPLDLHTSRKLGCVGRHRALTRTLSQSMNRSPV